jgi:cysteine synthase
MRSDRALVSGLGDLVGATPLVEIPLDRDRPRARVLAKCEQYNPTGSFKDRLAPTLLSAAQRAGATALVVPSSGNLAVALALLAKSVKLAITAVLPATVPIEMRQLCELYGAKVVLSDPEQQLRGAVARAKAIAGETLGAHVVSSFEGFDASEVYAPFAREILSALPETPIDAFVVGLGSGALATGAGRALKAAQPALRVVGVEPESAALFSGGVTGPTKMHDLAAGFVASDLGQKITDEIRAVSDARAWSTKRELGTGAGLLVGTSSGATVAIALDVARELGPGKTVVTVLGDTGERYFSMGTFLGDTPKGPRP